MFNLVHAVAPGASELLVSEMRVQAASGSGNLEKGETKKLNAEDVVARAEMPSATPADLDPAPEPASVLALGAGLSALLLRNRKGSPA